MALKSIRSTIEKLISSICIDGEKLIHRQHDKHFFLTFISHGRLASTVHGQKAAATYTTETSFFTVPVYSG